MLFIDTDIVIYYLHDIEPYVQIIEPYLKTMELVINLRTLDEAMFTLIRMET